MRSACAGRALFHQAQTLVHTETVLFIDNDQPQFLVLQSFLKQRVSADYNLRFTGRNRLIGAVTLFALERSGQPRPYAPS